MAPAARLAGLDQIRDAVWKELQRAVHDKHHAWRTPVLATIEAGQPDARTVVLREVDIQAQQLVFFSDARARKVSQLRQQAAAVLVFWSKSLGWQLRCAVHCQVDDDLQSTAARWKRLRDTPAAQDYLSPIPPGAGLPAGDPDALPSDATPSFAVVSAHVFKFDWLELDRRGHRRASFESTGSGWRQP